MCMQDNPFLVVHRYLFFHLGDCICNCPKNYLWITAGICIFLSLGLHNIRFKDNFRDGYFLKHSKSVEEHNAFLQFHNFKKMPYMMAVIGECAELECSMIEEKYFMKMKNETMHALRTVLPSHDFCGLHHRTLKSFLIYSSEAHFSLLEKHAKTSNSSEVVLKYPYMISGPKHMSMQHIVYGAAKGSVFALRFLMGFNISSPAVFDLIKAAELQWYQRLKMRNDSNVKMYLLGDELVDYEIQKAASSTPFYFIMGASLMVIVVYCITLQYQKKHKANIFLTFMIIVCPILAATATMGLFSILDVHINSMMMIIPFLVLGVGVDDAFLLMRPWFHSKAAASTRFCLVYTDVGPSITLSSLTNVAAFLIGYVMSPSMDIARFCLCSATAFALCWLLEIFVFAPQLWLYCSGRASKKNHSRFHIRKRYFKKYGAFLQKFSFCHVVILLLMLALYASCIFMIINMEENFAPEKTFDNGSFLAKSLASLNKIYSDHQMVRIIAAELPKNVTVLRDDIARIKTFHYLCDNYTIWLDLYEELYQPTSTDIREYFSQLPNFFKHYPETKYYLIYSDDSNGSLSLNKISFELCLRGFANWRDRAMVANSLRETLPKSYSMFFYDSHIFDLILSIKGTILKAIAITVVVMTIICLFFLPAIRIAVCTILSLLSIITLVMGGLCVWGAELDVVLMVNVVMAAGFTVDYVSHISYSLFTATKNITVKPVDRMTRTLRTISGPTAQAMMTTVTCVAPLLFHKVYMYVIFAKTVFLCSIFGFLHAVFVMPFLVSLMEIMVPSRFEPSERPTQTFYVTLFNNGCDSSMPENGENAYVGSSPGSSVECYESTI